MARPLIQDAALIDKLRRGELAGSPCEPCNRCVAEMERDGVYCPHPALGAPRRRGR
jgi:hypothetical protein